MAGLADHVLGGTDHGGLPFHPACAVCRQARLAGTLPDGSLFSGRTKAGLAAGLIAAATFAPTSVAVAGPDFVLEPTEQGADPTPEPEDEPESDGGPVDEQEALAPPDDLDTLPGTGSVPPGGPGGSLPPAGAPGSGPPTQTPAATDPTQVNGVVPGASVPVVPPVNLLTPGTTQPAKPPKPDKRHAPGGAESPGARDKAPGPPAPVAAPAPPAAPQNAAASGAAQVAPNPPVTGAATGAEGPSPAASASGIHVVQRGESLWSIARGLAGPGASNAEIASLVNRLWELNADSIGTGDPDLILVGQKLRLPG